MFQIRGLGDVLPSYCSFNPYDPSCAPKQATTSTSLTSAVKSFITSGLRPKAKHPTKTSGTPAAWGGWDCMINPKDPKCGGKPASTGSNTTTGGGQKPPGLPGSPLFPTAGTQINPLTGQPYPAGAINPATGLPYGVVAQPAWYTQWWGLALIAGVGYGVYTLVK